MHIVFGGSFNPPTKAHQEIVFKLIEVFPSSKVLILPVGSDYQRKELISFEHRYHMLNLMFKDVEQILILKDEDEHPYEGTLKALDRLSKRYDDIHFVIGSDNLKDLFTWINYQKLLKKYPMIVMNRNHYTSKEEADALFQSIEHHFTFIDFSYDISSTQVRENIEKYKESLTQDVYTYILKNQLYKEPNHV